MDGKRKYLNRILFVCGSSALLLFLGYVFFTKRSPRHYYIPDGFEGWVTVKYESKDAPQLPEEDGALQLNIPASGILETSNLYEDGWGRDEFFWKKPDGSTELIPRDVVVDDENRRFIHDRESGNIDYNFVVPKLPPNTDTIWWDGARIKKTDGPVADIRTGRTTLEHFYVTPAPTPDLFPHDSVPDVRKEW